MTQHIYIGIDGGGTACTLRMENADGQLLALTKSGPANVSHSPEQAWTSIHTALSSAKQQAGIPLNALLHVGLGLAGTENTKAVATFLAKPHGFTSCVLTSDAHTACLGAHNGKDGAIIISGTGIVGYALIQGKTRRVSGWGFSLGEVGSGAWLGYEAVRWMLRWRDKRCASTPFLQALFKKIKHEVRLNATLYASLVPLMLEYPNDMVTRTLLAEAATEIETLYHTLHQGEAKLPLCFVGGLAKTLLPYLSYALQEILLHPQQDASQGAILLLRGKNVYHH